MRSILTMNAGGRHSERQTIREFADEKTMGVHFGRSAGRDVSIGFGYSIRHSAHRLGSGTERPAWSNDVQFEIERRWRHSAGRRTALGISAGPSLLQQELPSTSLAAASNRFHLVGAAVLTHDMGRSWNVSGSYRRGAGSVDGLLSDAAAVDLRGLISARAELTFSTGYSQTSLGLGGPANRYATKFGSGRVQVALSRAAAVYAQYVLYGYEFGNLAPVPASQPLQQQRRGVRAGLTLWVPIEERR
jgi:hypothetical protein